MPFIALCLLTLNPIQLINFASNITQSSMDGNFLFEHAQPPPPAAHDATEDNTFHPFEDRLAFNWAHYHFTELQSSEQEINKGMDLWLAMTLKASNNMPLPWSSVEEMYQTIDAIQEGDVPFETIHFKYGDTFTPRPYRQFDHMGDRVWSNLMSGDWAWNEADTIAQDECTHGAMLIPIISGSDKTTVSVATGHQEYHPVYESPGIITNTVRCAHGNAVLLVAFLPIPKSFFAPFKQTPMKAHRISELCLADVPHVWLVGIIQGWCPKCEAKPDNLDGNLGETHHHKHERTDFIIKCFDPGIIWEKYGVWSDVVLIKGTFKDHLVMWVNEYLHVKYGETQALKIIHDIDRRFLREGLLCGSTAGHFAPKQGEESELDSEEMATSDEEGGSDIGEDTKQGFERHLGNAGPEDGPQSLSSITLVATPERWYLKDLNKLAQYINEPNFPSEFKSFLYSIAFGATPHDSETDQVIQCALVSWFLPTSDQHDPDTVQVIPLKSIARGAHLLPKYGVGMLPDHIMHTTIATNFCQSSNFSLLFRLSQNSEKLKSVEKDSHSIKERESACPSFCIVGLKGHYGLCNDLQLWVTFIEDHFIFNDYKENQTGVIKEAHISLCDPIGITADCERDDIVCHYKGVIKFIEFQKLQSLHGKVVDKALLGVLGGKIEIPEIICSRFRNVHVGVTMGSEDGRVKMV
ncbi:hypothetical protein CPB84DRAFT_1880549 [Gymnopilus junonius]|uniref:JmjC domain-containing protein n=1 Tax=Gymnopilus junonius TaxID=109634 RepID=A0A9P5NCY6_GYMJU|nr:hypothetical protein CPB84DRAFT_1880549 [Gymnopilus junonius]